MQDSGLIDSTSPRAIALWEIISVTVSCLIAEWVVLSFLGRYRWLVIIPLILAIAFMVASHRAHGETLRSMGFRTDNLLAALRLLLAPTLIAVALILVVGWFLSGSPSVSKLFRPRLLLLPLWALFQQYALQAFFNRRAELALGKGYKSIVLVGVIFSVLHLPNLVLSGLTLIGGVIWSAVYQRQANLYALAASQTVASLSLAMALPLNVINGLRVGFKYFG
jgi:hypothetical protein